MLTPLGGFGQFILVLLSLTIIANLAGTIYAVTLNFQALLPVFVRIPRVAYAAVTTVIMIPIAVKAAESFFANLENFVGVIGYWSASWVAVVLIEHFWFRRGDAVSYAIAKWNDPKALPSGIAALAAGSLSMALAIPSMSQVWYVGPIGLRTGDIGFEMAGAVTALLYVPFRYLEKRIGGKER
jgi:purine-cytosine permease-like protein